MASVTSSTSPNGGSPRCSMTSSTMAIRLRPGAFWASAIALLLSPVADTIPTGCDTTADQSSISSAVITPCPGWPARPGWLAGLSAYTSRGFAALTSDPGRGCGGTDGGQGCQRASMGRMWIRSPAGRARNPCTRVEDDPLGEPLSQQAAQPRRVRPIPGMHGGRGLDLDCDRPAGRQLDDEIRLQTVAVPVMEQPDRPQGRIQPSRLLDERVDCKGLYQLTAGGVGSARPALLLQPATAEGAAPGLPSGGGLVIMGS